ncbi:MAG: glycosyltransferase [Nitrospira sp.]|nr:glycosyltransferase [Nitrospira sp.]
MLHWTALFGLLLGLCGTALAEWLPNRIVHMTATAGVGGGPAYLTALADHQLGSGMQVRVFCSDEKPYVEIWRRMPLDLSVLPMRRPNARSVWQLLKELLRAPAPIHAHGRGAAFFAIWVKILVRVPVIYTPHGPHYADNQGWRYPCLAGCSSCAVASCWMPSCMCLRGSGRPLVGIGCRRRTPLWCCRDWFKKTRSRFIPVIRGRAYVQNSRSRTGDSSSDGSAGFTARRAWIFSLSPCGSCRRKYPRPRGR